MSLLLQIDTAAETALVQLCRGDEILAVKRNLRQHDHAAFLHPAIANIFQSQNIKPAQLDAVAVTEGPGSYTGIRIGLAAAKGLCFALDKPLITINRLSLMAIAAQLQQLPNIKYYVPLMDARRMEVFTAVYDENTKCLFEPAAIILDEHSFSEWLSSGPTLFFGSGLEKWTKIQGHHPHYRSTGKLDLSQAFATEAMHLHQNKNYVNLVDSQPFYAKDFYTG